MVIIILFACKNERTKKLTQQKNNTPNIEVKTFDIPESNYHGYEILINGEIYIHQEHIPAIEGKHFFLSKKLAIKIGNAVKDKLEQNKNPGLTKNEILNLIGDYKN